MTGDIDVRTGEAVMVRFAFGYGGFTIIPNTPDPDGDGIQVQCYHDSKFSWNGESIPATKEGLSDLLVRLWNCEQRVSFKAIRKLHSYETFGSVEFVTVPFVNQSTAAA